MNRIVLLMMIFCVSLCASAQKNVPKWMDKARKAVVKVTTYDKDNRQIGSGYGFFVTESGEVLSGYAFFKDAYRAVVTDFEGKEYAVTHIIGADEFYDVIRIRTSVPKKPAALTIAKDPVPVGSDIYQLFYSPGKSIEFKQGTITEVSKLKDSYTYYQLDLPLESIHMNIPLVNANGEVLGLAQEDASGKNEFSYAISAVFTGSLEQSSLDIFNSTYRNVHIKKAWSSNVEDAAVSLFIRSGQQDVQAALETVNDFISTFPNSPEGYQYRASIYVYRRNELNTEVAQQNKYLDLAKADFEKALQVTKKQDDTWYDWAKVIYGAITREDRPESTDWSAEKGLEIIQKAIQVNDLPVYHQMKADFYLLQGDFQKAYDTYMIVNNSELANANSYYWAAKALEQIEGTNMGELIALLDKAIEISGTGTAAGPYILERIDKRLILGQYDEAIEDYDHYYFVMNGKVNDTFYYLREQAKFRKGDLPGALEDINEALKMDPESPDYLAEQASVYIRLQQYEDALKSVEKALALAPDFAACYRLRGVCYLRTERKNEACEAFHQAQELGDPVAEKLINDNCQ